MVYFVIYSRGVDRSLVRDNYYDYDIGYEKLIGEKKRNSNALEFPLEIEYDNAKSIIRIKFPDEIKKVSGEIWLYRVNNEKLDLKLNIETDTSNIHVVDIKKFAGGKWKVNVDWVGDGKAFLDSKDIYIN